MHIKGILAAAVAGLLANSAMAADGTINFTGEIIAASCEIKGGPGTTVGGSKGQYDINVNLGKVSIDSLGSAGGGIAGGTNINLDLDCGKTGTGLKKVRVKFDPNGGSKLHPQDNRLLGLTTLSTAKGVGIGMFKQDGTMINLANSNDVFEDDLIETGTAPNITYTAKLQMRAGYVMAGAPGGVSAGTANGTLPFTLDYL
ncbi:Fimbrial protein [compost metagenome]